MAQDVSLASMSLGELKKLHTKIINEVQKRERLSKLDVLKRIEQVAREAGLSVADLVGGKSGAAFSLPKASGPAKRGKTGKVKPKYQNPNNLSQTWTGRGRKPDWVKAHLGTGRALEALLIDKGPAIPPPPRKETQDA